MSSYKHISPDNKRRPCKNPAKCPYRVIKKENGMYMPENMDSHKKKQVKRLHASGVKVSFLYTVDEVSKIRSKKESGDKLEKSPQSDIDFISEDVNMSRDDILKFGNPLKLAA